jgi:hypothetical protein
VLDGVYLNRDGVTVFHEAAAPTVEELEALLAKIITRTMRTLTRLGVVIEEPEGSYLAETDTNGEPWSTDEERRWTPAIELKEQRTSNSLFRSNRKIKQIFSLLCSCFEREKI